MCVSPQQSPVVGSTDLAVRAEGLCKRFGDTRALDGLDLAIPQGTICGLLGPNGSGKSTTVRILSTLLRPDAGHAEVGGFDVVRDPMQVRYHIGLTGQTSAVDDVLSARGNLEMFGRLYHLNSRASRRRADELLEQFGLTESANQSPKKYSGGMRRRLDLAISFIMSPPVLFLDEPTTGLDPAHRSDVWQGVRSLVEQGTTVLLTTHYMDEADQLADRISVIDHGHVIAEGTPDELKSAIGGDQIAVVFDDPADLDHGRDIVARATGEEPQVHRETRRISAPVRNRVGALTEILGAIVEAGLGVHDIALRRPTLDEVFVRITGHRPTAAAHPESVP